MMGDKLANVAVVFRKEWAEISVVFMADGFGDLKEQVILWQSEHPEHVPVRVNRTD